MKKLAIITVVMLFALVSFAANTLTNVDVSFTALTTLTATTVSANATYTIDSNEDFKTGLVIITSATAGTITFFSGDYDGSIYGNYVVNPATNTTFIYNPDTFRFQEFDGDMFFKVEGLTSTKISLFTMP